MDFETSLTSEQLEKDVAHLKEWMSKELHLPKIDDDEWLITFLHHNKYSLEKTKTKLDNYFSMRNKYPHLLKNRDPTSPEIRAAGIAYNISYADRLTKNGERIVFIKPNPDTSLFNLEPHLKRVFMVFDLLYLENDRPTNCITIADFRTLSYVHFLKGIAGIKIGNDVIFNAYPARIKAMHVINPPIHLDKVVDVFKSALPKKIRERFFIHSSPEDLCRMVDEDVVCSDFGGKGPSLARYDEHTRQTLEKHRKWFLEQDSVYTNELLRRKDKNQLEDMKGSFRKLEID